MRDLTALPEASEQRCFGVVAIRQGWEVEHVAPAEALYDVGCTARLHTVRAQADGGFRIVTVGGDRFRLLDVVVGDDPPYLQGQVEWLAPDETDGAPEDTLRVLVRGVRDLFLEYVAEVAALGLGRDDVEVATMLKEVADDPSGLSWLVATSALLTAEDRQELLAESATGKRLRRRPGCCAAS